MTRKVQRPEQRREEERDKERQMDRQSDQPKGNQTDRTGVWNSTMQWRIQDFLQRLEEREREI